MASYFRSDVYYEEQDLSQVVSAIATSIGAIVGAATRGPLGKRRVPGADDYVRAYGVPDASVSFMGYCSSAFLEQSNELWVNRVVGAGASWGVLYLQRPQPNPLVGPDFGASALVGGTASDPDRNGIDFVNGGAAKTPLDNIFAVYPLGPGGYSRDMSFEIRSDNIDKPTNAAAYDFSTIGVIIAGVDAKGDLPAGEYEYGVSAMNRVGETPIAVCNKVTLPGGVASYVTWDKQANVTGYKVYRKDKVSGKWGYMSTVGMSYNFFVDKGLSEPDTSVVPQTKFNYTPLFTVLVYDDLVSKNMPLETFDCTLRDYTDGMGVQREATQQINGPSKAIRIQTNVGAFIDTPPVFSVARTYFPAGDSGKAVTASDIIRGWDDFKDEEDVDIRLMINGGYAIPSVQLAMNSIAKSRKDCMAILDIPSHRQEASSAIDYRNIDLNLNDKRAAIYASDLLIQDKYSGKRLFVPPSGHVAGVYAYTDATTYPWRAPAGLNRGLLNVLGVRYKYNKGDRDSLWKAQINYIRDFKGIGRAVWEQRTMQAFQSGYSYVNVVRLMDYLAIGLRRAVLFKEFEPNDEVLRLELKSLAEEIIRPVIQARGIKKALVVCDNRNNSSRAENLGELYLDFIIQPTIPGEKIIIRSTLTKAGVDMEELIAAGAVF